MSRATPNFKFQVLSASNYEKFPFEIARFNIFIWNWNPQMDSKDL